MTDYHMPELFRDVRRVGGTGAHLHIDAAVTGVDDTTFVLVGRERNGREFVRTYRARFYEFGDLVDTAVGLSEYVPLGFVDSAPSIADEIRHQVARRNPVRRRV